MSRIRAAVLVVIAVIAVAVIPGVTLDRSVRPDTPIPLGSAEISSYQGERLSPVSDFRENSIRGPQNINESDYRLTITGLTSRTLVFSYRDVIDRHRIYSKVVTLHCVEGWDATILWEGVLVSDLISEAGIGDGAATVIFTAHDGYTTSLPLEYIMNHNIIMAHRMNNLTLPAERGFPFQLVAEDKWGYKWIKWIERIELSGDSLYRGYWEQRGYSHTADLTAGFFDDR